MSQLYEERFNRYVTALRNGTPDKIPIRPFAAEFTARYAGFTCQEVTHDYDLAFRAMRKCASDFDWDAVPASMVYVWTGLSQAIGLKYYATPGLEISADTAFQFLEPPDDQSFMRADEYDQLIEDPTGYLLNVWLPRVSKDVSPLGEPSTSKNNLSFLKGGMAMLSYFNAFGPAIDQMKTECGTVSAIAGIFKAPLDILGDKLRGYMGLTMDLLERPEVVLKACEALMPHLLHVALTTADPDKNVPVGFWMHRGGVPFVKQEHFDTVNWPTLKPIIEALWAHGHQTMFYAEGNWDAHLDAFAELEENSILYHVDQGDIAEVHRVLGKKFCISGGIPNAMLSYGTPDEVRARCKEVIDAVAGDGGYIMDASAIIQNDATVENMKAMTEFTRDYGVYSSSSYTVPENRGLNPSITIDDAMAKIPVPALKAGACVSWEQKRKDFKKIQGDEHIFERIWDNVDALANMYVWQCLLSF
ncbi:MAG: hypothetical protein L3K26_17515 [Candidatus Hydrogenedentes bacterium]|nr:hypothetical protein [Candidatus Hydrogenedentota bacterium]